VSVDRVCGRERARAGACASNVHSGRPEAGAWAWARSIIQDAASCAASQWSPAWQTGHKLGAAKDAASRDKQAAFARVPRLLDVYQETPCSTRAGRAAASCGESAGPHVWIALLCQGCDVSVCLQVRLARQHQRVIQVCAVQSSTQRCARVFHGVAGPTCGSAGLCIRAKAEHIHDCCVRTEENRLQVRRAAHNDCDVSWPASNRLHSLPSSPTAPPKPDGQSSPGLLHTVQCTDSRSRAMMCQNRLHGFWNGTRRTGFNNNGLCNEDLMHTYVRRSTAAPSPAAACMPAACTSSAQKALRGEADSVAGYVWTCCNAACTCLCCSGEEQ